MKLEGGSSTYEIELRPSGRRATCKEGQTLLDALIRSGINVPYSCRQGHCSTCKARVLEGEYEILERASEFVLMGYEREQGYVLTCSTVPETDVVLEVQEEEFEPGVQLFAIQDFVGTVVKNIQCTPDIHRLWVQLETPENVPYAPGQYFEFAIPGTHERRAYSMAAPYRSRFT